MAHRARETLSKSPDPEDRVADVSTDTVDVPPVAYLRILPQQELEPTDYPIYAGTSLMIVRTPVVRETISAGFLDSMLGVCVGESSIGRDVDCDLSIDAVSLSRKHAVILVERGTHFVLDNASRNKTLRGVVSGRKRLAK